MSKSKRLFDLKKIAVLSLGIFHHKKGYKLAGTWHPQNSLYHKTPFKTHIAVQFIVFIGLIMAALLALVGPVYLFPGTFVAHAANQTLTVVNQDGVAPALQGANGLINVISSKTSEVLNTINSQPFSAPPTVVAKEGKAPQPEANNEIVDKSISPNFIIQAIADSLNPLLNAPKQVMFPAEISLDQKDQKELQAKAEAKEKEEQAKTPPTPTPAPIQAIRPIPTKTATKIVLAATNNVPDLPPSGDFIWPVRGGISTYFSNWHPGIDIMGPYGTTILAAMGGVVQAVGYDSYGLGNRIIISHPNSFSTTYAHLSTMSVKVGQTVTKGMGIGAIGLTGHTTGSHLHFELWLNAIARNPLSFLH